MIRQERTMRAFYKNNKWYQVHKQLYTLNLLQFLICTCTFHNKYNFYRQST